MRLWVKLPYKERLAAARRLSPEKRKRFADILRRFDPNLELLDPNQKSLVFPELMALGDDATIDYLEREIRSSQERGVYPQAALDWYMLWHSAKAIPLWMEVVRKGTELRDYEWIYTENSRTLMLISRSPELSNDVREWAYETEKSSLALRSGILAIQNNVMERGGVGVTWETVHVSILKRQVLSDWWSYNQANILKGAYGEVRPGDVLWKAFQTQYVRTDEEKVRFSNLMDSVRESVRMDVSPEQAKEVLIAEGGGSSRASGIYTLLGGMGLVAGLFVWVWRSRRRR